MSPWLCAGPDPPSWVLTIMPKLLDVADAEGFLAPQQLMQRASAPSGLRHLRRMRVRFLEPEHAQAPLQWEQPRGGDLPDALHIRWVPPGVAHCGPVRAGAGGFSPVMPGSCPVAVASQCRPARQQSRCMLLCMHILGLPCTVTCFATVPSCCAGAKATRTSS